MIGELVAWGVTSVGTFAFVEVLKNLLQGATEDYVKDFFKDTLKSGVEHIQGSDLKKAVGKAYQEFLDCVHDEFVAEGLEEDDARKYSQSLEKLLRNPEVKKWLSSAFHPERKLDNLILSKTYEQLHLLPLPKEFSWKRTARLYGKRVEKIILESPKLREIFTASNIQATTEATKQIVGIVPGFDLNQYCKNLNDRYGYLKLANIDATDQNYRVRLWQIFIPQDVREELPPHRYELPLDVLQRLQTGTSGDIDPDQIERYKERYFQSVPKPTLEVVQKCSHVVILGDPGAGKSTLLQYLALNWAEKPTEQIPLMVELREYVRDETQPRDFLKFWHQGCRNICDLNQFEVDHELKAGATRVLLDGLDEVIEPDVKDRVIGEIIKFKNEYPHTQIIVTSRIIGYDSERLSQAGFRHLTLQELSKEQIKTFVGKWHDLALGQETDREEIQARLQKALDNSSALGLLAGNPLLLTMMAILNRRQELPRRRADLYEECTKVLLHQWDLEYKNLALSIDDVDLRSKQALLRDHL